MGILSFSGYMGRRDFSLKLPPFKFKKNDKTEVGIVSA